MYSIYHGRLSVHDFIDPAAYKADTTVYCQDCEMIVCVGMG